MLGLHLRTTGDERWNDAVRHRPRRREHVHVVPHRDRRAPARAVDDCPTAATARTRRCGRTASRAPASGCSCTTCCAAPTTTRCSTTGGTTCAATKYLHLDERRAAAGGDALLRPDPRRAPRGAGDVRHGARAVPRAAGARRRASAVRGGHAASSACGSRRPGRAARPARVGDRAVAGEGVGTRARWPTRSTRRSTSTTSRRGTARAASSRGASSSTSRTRGGQYNGTMAAAQVATEKAWIAPRDRRARDRASPSRRSWASTSRRVALREAWWDAEQQTLFVTPEPIDERRRGTDDIPSRQLADLALEVELETVTGRLGAVGDALEVHTTRRRAVTSSAAV